MSVSFDQKLGTDFMTCLGRSNIFWETRYVTDSVSRAFNEHLLPSGDGHWSTSIA